MRVQLEGMWTVGYRQSVFELLEVLGHQRVASEPDAILVMGDKRNLCHTHPLRSREKRVIALFPEQDNDLCHQFKAMGVGVVVASASELPVVLTAALGS